MGVADGTDWVLEVVLEMPGVRCRVLAVVEIEETSCDGQSVQANSP